MARLEDNLRDAIDRRSPQVEEIPFSAQGTPILRVRQGNRKIDIPMPANQSIRTEYLEFN